ncbi:hypothetical protein cypCar_00033406, partial [Cyprinus carpio]
LSESGSDDGFYDCQHCGKRFKRQAYLRKHILGHQALQNQILGEAFRTTESPDIVPSEDSQSPGPLNLSPADCLACPVCGEKLPNRASLERHLRLLHDDSQAFPCKFCPATVLALAGSQGAGTSRANGPAARATEKQAKSSLLGRCRA